MMFDSDDDERLDPSKAKRSAAGLKSIFASDDRARQTGSQSLRYEGLNNKQGGGDDSFDFNTNRKQNNPGAPPVPAAGSSTIACNGAIHAYKGDQPIGAAAVVIAHSSAAGTLCVIIDREKRHLSRVKVNSEQFQLLPNPQQRQYATLYDPAFNGHWTLAFKGPAECNSFLAGAMTVQHFLLLPDGPRPPFVELAVADASAGPSIKRNDTAQVSLSVWLLAKKGPLTTIGKLVDEIVEEAPRRIVVGDGSIMAGVEDALIGMGVGGRKIVFVPPKKTKQNGLGNPEIGSNDTVVALVSVAAVEPYDASMGLEDAQRSAHQAQQQAALNSQNRRERGMSTRGRSGSQFGAAASSPSSSGNNNRASAAASSNAPTDTNALIQALLLKQLTEKDSKKKKKRRGSSSDDEDPEDDEEESSSSRKKSSSSGGANKKTTEKQLESSAFVERSLAMIQQQLAGLYEKLDRTDIVKKLDENNNKIEKIVKKAVGKSPVLDVDVEDAGKDREELLAKIEQLKEKAEQHKADYYAALETMGKHKDDVVALRNDVQIAERTSQEKIQELKERHRLEVVDNEVRNRRELERTAKEQFEEGKERGYSEGFNMGRIEGITQSGSASTEELRDELAKKESENIELQARLVELEAKGYEDRRAANEQHATLQGLIDRLEQRNANKERSVIDQGAMNAKFLRRVMNSTYAHIEEQFYATEKEVIPVADALSMVLISVKSETRQAADELKKLAVIQAKEPTPMQPLPFETASTAAVAADLAKKSPRNLRSGSEPSNNNNYSPTSSSAATSNFPPPPPPMMMKSSSSASQSASAQDLASQVENTDYNLDLTKSLAGAGGSGNNIDNSEQQQEDDAGEKDGNNNNNGLDEDYIQKMLAEYRATREKEISGGENVEKDQQQEQNEEETSATAGNQDDDDDDDNGNNINRHQDPNSNLEGTSRREESEDQQAENDNQEDQQDDQGDGNEDDDNNEDDQQQDDDGEDDYDEEEDEQPASRKKAPPRPPKVAQDEDDDW